MVELIEVIDVSINSMEGVFHNVYNIVHFKHLKTVFNNISVKLVGENKELYR